MKDELKIFIEYAKNLGIEVKEGEFGFGKEDIFPELWEILGRGLVGNGEN